MSEAITGSATRSEPTVRRIADHSVFARGFLLYISQSPTKTPANPLEGSMSANDANDPVPLLVRDRRRGSLYYVPAGTTIPPSFRLAEATTSPGRDIHEILYHHRPRVTDVSNLPTGSAPGSKSHSTTDTGDKLLEWLEMEDEDADEGTASVLFVHDPSMLDRLHEILHERLVGGQVGEDLHAEILCFYKEQERVGRVEKFEYEGSSLGAFRLGTASLFNTLLQAPGLYHSIETGRRAKESRWIDGKKFGRSILDFMLRIRDKPAVGGDGKRVAVYPIEGMRITQTTSADGEGYRLSCVGGALTCVDLEGYENCRKISSQVSLFFSFSRVPPLARD